MQRPGWMEQAKSFLLDGLTGVGNVLDVPGSMVRDAIGGENPFDQLASPWRGDNRLTGRDLARQWGLAGQEDTLGNMLGGIALELATDPLNIIPGMSVLSRLRTGSKLKSPLAAAGYFGKSRPMTPELKAILTHPANALSWDDAMKRLNDLPVRHPMLRRPAAEAEKLAMASSREAFMAGKPGAVLQHIGDPVRLASELHPAVASKFVNDVLPLNDTLRSTSSVAGWNPSTKTMMLNPSSGVGTIDHEMLHAAQTALEGRYPLLAKKMGVSDWRKYPGFGNPVVEPTALRRSDEANIAGLLWDYANRPRVQGPLRQFGAYQAVTAPARVGRYAE